MKIWSKPNLIISKCLSGNPCRYNGEGSPYKYLERLNPYVNLYEICPEEEIGLTTPRNPIKLFQYKENPIELLDSKTFKNYTKLMVEFSNDICYDIKNFSPHGFILKKRSPTCGTNDVKIYSTLKKGSHCKKGKGMFASILMENFKYIPIEDDGRLNNFKIREEFLTKIFILAEFDKVFKHNSFESLKIYNEINSLLFMSYNLNLKYKLDYILKNTTKYNLYNTFNEYKYTLLNLISKTLNHNSLVNTYVYVFNIFKGLLSIKEVEFFLNIIEKFKNGNLPKCVIINLIKNYAVRFSNHWILSQSILLPFPEELIDLSDSGKGIVIK